MQIMTETHPASTGSSGVTRVRITDTTLRDAHQSLWATRMRRGDIEGIIDAIDSVGYYSLEVWGGATFDVCLRFLREDPWERLRFIRSRTKTPTQMLLRAQNLVGYRNYPDDVVDRFAALAVKNGMDVFRIFDALNDSRNLEAPFKAVRRHGGHVQGVLCYARSPVHTVETYMRYAREQVQIGIDSLAIKDMAGILDPIMAEAMVSALKAEFPDLPVQIHCHATSGMAMSAYLAGVRAGAGAIDTATAPMSGFSSQPAVETMQAIFEERGYTLDLDQAALDEVARYFAKLDPIRRQSKGPLPYVDRGILKHQIPGGMISNFRSQLAEQGALDRMPDVEAEVAQVRAELGFPPLVTPMSQIVGTQALMNVIAGERYKLIPKEVRDYARGLYGHSPAPIDPEIMKTILGDDKPIDHRPADDLAPALSTATDGIDPGLIQSEEDILSLAILPEPALAFFEWRALPAEKRPPPPADLEDEKRNGAPASAPPPAGTAASTNGGTTAAVASAPTGGGLGPASSGAIGSNGSPRAAGGGPPGGSLGPDDYRGVAEVVGRLAGVRFDEVSIRKGDFALRITAPWDGTPAPEAGATWTGLSPAAFGGEVAGNGGGPEVASAAPQAAPPPPSPEPAQSSAPEPAPAPSGPTIDAPLTGTFYRAPGPGKPSFVEEGDEVEAGGQVCTVEAMKLFNEITAPVACRLERFLVEDGTRVEKGQPLVAYAPR